MATSDFTTTLVIDQNPTEAFNAINNVRGWWSEEIEGSTDKLNEEFTYHFEDVHSCRMKIIELIPNRKVVWHVLDNYFSFTTDKNEWKDTKIIFEITEQDHKTQIRFTHQGLVPEYECYDVCREAWTNYINNSLRRLITTGKGQPNPKEGRNDFQESITQKLTGQDYHASFTVNVTPLEVFNAINSVSRWWTENVEGGSQKLNDEFAVHFGDIHYSRQRLVEVIPGKKIVWLVTDSNLSWLKNKQEWTNTKISFEISTTGKSTQLSFTHIGLIPEVECFNDCSKGWDQYIKDSLFKLLTEGKGHPDKKIRKASFH
ncbi:MAG: SRPBCC domain-containing protein [Paludibacter sp.]|nr:SRPBCC domain-containing protein [Paludibacter sp.]